MSGLDPNLVKVSVLAQMSGVPAATIKHYVREGLLPEPVRTSRNMAYYDSGLVERIQRIKELQRTRFLPLKVIKEVLDEADIDHQNEAIAATIARVLEEASADDERTLEELLSLGTDPVQLDWLKRFGIVTPIEARDAETYAGDDLEILRVLGTARKAGLTEDMLPLDILGQYLQAIQSLVEMEVGLFIEQMLKHTEPENLAPVTEAATMLSERLVTLLRRKLLVPTLASLNSPANQTPPDAT